MSTSSLAQGLAFADTAADPVNADADLVRRARRGDTAAQRALFVTHAPSVGRLLRRLLGRATDVEDGVQHTFLVAFERLSDLQRPELFRQWVFTIATRHARRAYWFDKLRSVVRLETSGEDASLWDARELSFGLGADERAELVFAGRRLAALPMSLREPWVLRFIEGCSLEEISDICGCSLATTKRRLEQAQRGIEGAQNR